MRSCCILFCWPQPELDQRLSQHHMRQLRQRITFRACLRPLDLAETVSYIEFRLGSAGCEHVLFELAQYREIWKASQGIPPPYQSALS